jgi:hypothetical protein
MKLCAAMACAAVAFAAGARAETVNSSHWGFSATFPCQSEISTQPVTTAQGNVTMTSYACHEGGRRYLIAFADFPAGSITKETAESGYDAAVNSVASAAGGTIRAAVVYPLGDISGRDVVVDMASKKKAIHARIFYLGDRQFQVMFLGPAGEENGKVCLDFLNSFAAVK